METTLKDGLVLDVPRVTEKICAFISDFTDATRAKGVVIGISGGLDSAVVASLSSKSLGTHRVLGLYLPERDTAPESEIHARAVAATLGIQLDTVNLTPSLAALGCYRGTVPSLLKGKLIGRAAAAFLKVSGYNHPFKLNLEPGEHTLVKEGVAFLRLKHRMRMSVLFHRAEREGKLVAGCLNRTEHLTGFYVRYGDSAADLAPIFPLYKGQVRQLAAQLNLPQSVLDRPPSPDMIPGLTDEIVLGMTYDQLDLILLGLTREWSPEEIARELDVSPKRVRQMAQLVALAANITHEVASPRLYGEKSSQHGPGKV